MVINKKGITNQLIAIFIMVLLLIVIIVGYFIWALLAPIGTYTSDIITTTVEGASADLPYNGSYLVNITVGTANTSVQGIQWLSYGILFAFIMSFIIVAFFVRTYPFLIFFWILFTFILAFVSIFLSITFTNISNSNAFLSAAYDSWGANSYLMSYLPHLLVGAGVIGGIILFALVSRDSETEVGSL